MLVLCLSTNTSLILKYMQLGHILTRVSNQSDRTLKGFSRNADTEVGGEWTLGRHDRT